jgi:hypothetical protein
MDTDNQVTDFWEPNNGPVDLKVGPDGALYYLSIFSGEVRKFVGTEQKKIRPQLTSQ